MSIGQDLGLTLPTIGQLDWGGDVNDIFTAIIAAVESPVTADGLDINDDLDVQGHSVINVADLQFVQEADPGTANTAFIGTDGNLYFRDGTNVLIQFTSNGTLNVTVSGGIVGLAGTTASVTYNSGTGVFQFVSAPGVAAILDVGDVRLRQGADANYLALKAPASLASDVSLTFPGAYPSGKAVVTVDPTGSIDFCSNAVVDNRGMIVSGTLVVSGSLRGDAGNLPLVGTMTATQSGSFQVVHAVRDILHANTFTLQVPGALAAVSSPGFVNSSGLGVDLSTGGQVAWIPVSLKVGDYLTAWSVHINKGTATGKVTAILKSVGISDGVLTNVGGHTNSTTSISRQTLFSGSLNHTIAAAQSYAIHITGGGTSGDTIYAASIAYSRPTGSV